jgi:O-antigen/teichoic acid export membrane protein
MDRTIKFFLQQMLTYGLGGIMNGLSRLALIPIISVYLPPNVFGLYSLLLMVISFLFVFFDLGLSYALIKYYSESGEPHSRATAVGTSITLLGAGGGVACLIALLLSPRFSDFLFQSSAYTPLLRVAICIALGSSVFQLFTSMLRASAQSRSFVLVTAIRGLSHVAFTIALVVLLSLGIEGFLWGALLSFALGIIAFLIIFRPAMAFSGIFAGKLLRFGLPLMPSNLAVWLLTYADLYLLKTLAGLKEVGLYQFAQEMCVVLSLVLVSFERAWPQFVFSQYKDASAVSRFQRVFVLFFGTMTFFGLAISLFRLELLSIVSASAYVESARVIPLLICSGILYGTSYVFGAGLLIQGKTFFFPLITVSAAVLNVVLNILLIPSYGIVGAGVATVLTNALMSAALLVLSNRYFPMSFNLSKVVLIGSVAVGAYAVHHVFRGEVPFPWVLNALLLVGFCLGTWKIVWGCLRGDVVQGTSGPTSFREE